MELMFEEIRSDYGLSRCFFVSCSFFFSYFIGIENRMRAAWGVLFLLDFNYFVVVLKISGGGGGAKALKVDNSYLTRVHLFRPYIDKRISIATLKQYFTNCSWWI